LAQSWDSIGRLNCPCRNDLDGARYRRVVSFRSLNEAGVAACHCRRGALNDVVEKRKSRVVWYPVERDVNVYPMMAASAEELASQGL
jgi:hypothetical protein